MAFYLTCSNVNQERPSTKTPASMNFSDLSHRHAKSKHESLNEALPAVGNSNVVLLASRSAPPCSTQQQQQQHMSVKLANDQSRRRSSATASPFKAHLD